MIVRPRATKNLNERKKTMRKFVFAMMFVMWGMVGAKVAEAQVISVGGCPEGMVRGEVQQVTWDSNKPGQQPVVVNPPPATCVEVQPVVVIDDAPAAPLSDEELIEMEPPAGPSVQPILDAPPVTPLTPSRKLGRWSVGVLLGYPSKDIGPVVMATLSGTFRRGELGELRLEGAAGMTQEHIGLFGGAALAYGHLGRHWLLGIGPTLGYQARFSKMLEEPSARQLGGAAEVAYQVKVSSPTDLDLEVFARLGGAWQRLDREEKEPLRDSFKIPFYIGWRGLF